jgi:hypothetical protein
MARTIAAILRAAAATALTGPGAAASLREFHT